jgi:dTDP-4-dehydrorhamnose 3,5-epimerase-like enzyme
MASGVAGKYSVQHLPVVDPPLPHSGGRMVNASGEMAQIIGNEPVRHVVYIDFKADGKPRGNHYHVKMQMHGIYIIQGKLRVTLVDVDDESRDTVTLQAGDFIRTKSRCAHVFVAEEYSQALELNDTPFDPADTIPYVILKTAKEKL